MHYYPSNYSSINLNIVREKFLIEKIGLSQQTYSLNCLINQSTASSLFLMMDQTESYTATTFKLCDWRSSQKATRVSNGFKANCFKFSILFWLDLIITNEDKRQVDQKWNCKQIKISNISRHFSFSELSFQVEFKSEIIFVCQRMKRKED